MGFVFFIEGTAQAAEDIRDVKPPVDLPHNYFLLLLAVLVVVGAIFLIRHFLGRRRQEPQKPTGPVKSPWEIAYENLEKLRAERLIEQGNVKEYYIRLSDIIRRYLEDRFSIRAPEMTTEEFLASLKDHGALPWEQKNFLKEFMNHCDMVKFAKHTATASEMEQSFVLAKKLVDETLVR